MGKLNGKTALVTGAGRGIGKGCALSLAAEGADIVLNDRPGSPDLEVAAEEIRSLGQKCWPVEGDAFSRAGCEKIVETALGEASGIDILVSNPAYNQRTDFLDYDPDVFDKTIAATLTGGFHMSQFVARHLVERGVGGKIVFISSVHGVLPFARAVAYNAAKAGLNHMTRTLAVELVRHKINVNAVAPGWIDTPGEREVFSDETVDSGGSVIPWGRLGDPGDIGKAALFLCSDDADYITGQIITVDGGISLSPYEANQLPTND